MSEAPIHWHKVVIETFAVLGNTDRMVVLDALTDASDQGLKFQQIKRVLQNAQEDPKRQISPSQVSNCLNVLTRNRMVEQNQEGNVYKVTPFGQTAVQMAQYFAEQTEPVWEKTMAEQLLNQIKTSSNPQRIIQMLQEDFAASPPAET